MTEFFLLRPKVPFGVNRRRNLERQPFGDGQTVSFEADQLSRIVREQPHRADPEVLEDLDADTIVTLIRLETEALVRFDSVQSLFLQFVRPELVREADASAFLV